jgi:replicative DNA helicase
MQTQPDKCMRDDQAEKGLLASIMLYEPAIEVCREIVSGSDFFNETYGKLFNVYMDLHDSGVPTGDITIVYDQIRKLNIVVTLADLVDVMHSEANGAHAAYYAEIVRECSRKRKLHQLGIDMVHRAVGSTTTSTQDAELAASIISGIDYGKSDMPQTIGDIAAIVIARLKENNTSTTRLFTGIAAIDSLTGSFLGGEVVVLAARPGCGKTAFAMQSALYNSERGRSVLFCSLEMKERELVTRVLCGRATVDSKHVRAGNITADDVAAMETERYKIATVPTRVWSPSVATIQRIRAVAKTTKAMHGLEYLIIDYIGLVKTEHRNKGESRANEVGEISKSIKRLAKELDIPILLLCQLNREADLQKPRLANLRESGDIEQDADAVIFLHNPGESNGDTTRSIDAIVAKHRHGSIGEAKVLFDPRSTSFVTSQEMEF